MAGLVAVDESTLEDLLLRLAADGTPDLQTIADVDGTYQFVSGTGLEPFGWTPADLFGEQLASFTHPDDILVIEDAHDDVWRNGTTVTVTSRFRCANGSYRWIEYRSRSIEAGAERLVISAVRDISERRESEVDLQHRGTSDPLTGVVNRTVVIDRLRHALHRLEGRRGLVAVLLQLAERLLQVLRPHDTLARPGGGPERGASCREPHRPRVALFEPVHR